MQANCNKKKTQFLDLPLDDLVENIFKYLSWNDLLRFRRVCHRTNEVTKDYFNMHPDRSPEIQITEELFKSFHAFTAMGIPTTKIYIKNPSGSRFFDGSTLSIQKFLNECASKIKQLRVMKFTVCPLGNEYKFLEGLVNLKHFQADELIYGKFVDVQVNRARAAGYLPDAHQFLVDLFPQNFASLEYIKLGPHEHKAADIIKRTGEVFWNCPRLKFASLPHCPTFMVKEDIAKFDSRFGTLMRDLFILLDYINSGSEGMFQCRPKSSLECYDFEHYLLEFEFQQWDPHVARSTLFQYYGSSAKLFMDICMQAVKSGLKLMNVNSLWFCGRWYEFHQNPVPSSIGTPVVSLVNLDPCMMDLEMPNLEKIWIPLTSHCVAIANDRPGWPKLKILDINVDGKVGHCWNMVGQSRFEDVWELRTQRTTHLFNSLFRDTIRINITELSVNFVGRKEQTMYAVPRTECIVSSCPNLKKIKLSNWQGKNSSLVKLWKGLLGLEEISLEYCQNVGNVAFVGEDVQNPAFLRLKNLKKLTFKGIDQMPKITDLLFSLVLKQISLKALILTSDKPAEQITKTGIAALLEGPFATSIEKFPFRDWSILNTTAEEFQSMETQFRSYNMV